MPLFAQGLFCLSGDQGAPRLDSTWTPCIYFTPLLLLTRVAEVARVARVGTQAIAKMTKEEPHFYSIAGSRECRIRSTSNTTLATRTASGRGARSPRGPKESFAPSANVREQSEAEALREAWEEMAMFCSGAAGEGSQSFEYPRRTNPVRAGTPWLASICFFTLLPNDPVDPFGDPGQRQVSSVGPVTHFMRFVDLP